MNIPVRARETAQRGVNESYVWGFIVHPRYGALPVSQPSSHTREEILGYRLIRKIGAGGYGEVWAAEAPGGLQKAVKIIFGYHDERLAQAELKSLQRIKDVRHPFLLSLERIEVDEGQLIVVSELADRSLAERFNQCQQELGSGIPRDELLGYVGDIADALDFLSEQHELQHLDIKPENLLLVGGHVKVADFGLVKDLRHVTQSLMTGMTPTYAAPEMFDGRPCPATDQYSLAIVYQEMLTAERPFPGTTPAQLAAQHMNGRPNLESLPISDRAVIARALSKDPADRFPNCRAMTDELLKRKSRKKVVRARTLIQSRENAQSNTVVFFDPNSPSTNWVTQKLDLHNVEFDSLDPPDLDGVANEFRPTLIVGIGQTANRTVQLVKQRLVQRYGDMDRLPGIQLLCIDNDRDDLTELTMERGCGSIAASETLAVPLRRPEEYRDQKRVRLDWLSRRWIYNIPRDLKTGGLRPLGRLAMADNFDELCKELHRKIEATICEENIVATCDALEMDPHVWRPRIFVLASVGGGLGSGATLDLAYTIRLMLAERGIVDAEMIGLLMFGVNGLDRDPNLATANAIAFLTELRHITNHGYPGDESLGIPPFDDELAFDATYFLHTNQNGSPNRLIERLKGVAEYLCLSTATPCAKFFDATRDMEQEREQFEMRTFGLSLCGPGNRTDDQHTVDRLANAMIRRWLARTPGREPDVSELVAKTIDQVAIQSEPIQQDLQAGIERFLDTDADALFQTIDFAQPTEEIAVQLVEKADKAWGLAALDSGVCAPPESLDKMEQFLTTRAERKGKDLAERILVLMREGRVDFQYYQAALDGFHRHLRSETEQLKQKRTKTGHQSEQLLALLRSLDVPPKKNDPPRPARRDVVRQWIDLAYADHQRQWLLRYYRVLQRSVTSVQEIVNQLRLQVQMLAEAYRPVEELDPEPPAYGSLIEQQMIASALQNFEKLVDRVECRVQTGLIGPSGGIFGVASNASKLRQRLPDAIQDAAKTVLGQAFREISIDQVISENRFSLDMIRSWLREQIDRARPNADCGGGLRMLAGLPLRQDESSLPELIAESFSLKLSAINGTPGDVVICFEGEGIELANVAYRLLQSAPNAMELVPRIHARTDVEWSSLNDLF